MVEVPGRWKRTGDYTPDPIITPEPQFLLDYSTPSYKQECSLFKQARHAK
jgi:hypothetical protein